MARPRVQQRQLSTEVVTDGSRLSALADDWAQLYADAPRATPFQTHAWLDAWWQAYGGSGSLRLVLVWSSDRLVAAAPLQLVRRGPTRVLRPLGGDLADFVDVLVAETAADDATAAVDALAAALRDLGGWDALDLPEVRPGAAAELLAEAWPGPRWRADASTCMELAVADFAAVLARLPAKRSREIRRVLRRSDELGLEVTDVSAAEVEGTVSELLALHADQWRGRGGNPEHQRSRFARHLTQALTGMVAAGQAAVTRYRLDGRVLAGQVVLIGHDLVGGYLLGVSPELYARMDFSTYVVRADLERACANRCSVYSMLRGGEGYKQRWEPDAVTNTRVVLTRGPLGRGYLVAIGARRRLTGLARRYAPGVRELRQRVLVARRERRNRAGEPPG